VATVGDRIATALDAVAIACSVLVTGLMVFLVIARYLLGLSVVGLHELILLFAVMLYMSGALIASRRGEHLTVDWLAQRLETGDAGPKAQAAHALFVALVTLVVALFFVAWTYWMFAWGMKRPQTTPGLGIPLWAPQLAILAASVGCTAYALRDVRAAALTLMGRR
jgi:TRAP-type C4-dicarboxylate transport system permease small subunit